MSPNPKCPFCLKEFDTVDEVIQHLLFDNCQTTETIEHKPQNGSNQTELTQEQTSQLESS